MNNTSPIIIIGMHRSGTTLLIEMLIKLGMFAGYKYGVNKEDYFFQRRNEWLLRRCAGGWDNPLSIHAIKNSDYHSEQVFRLLSDDVHGFSFRRHKKAIESGVVWGWKDPRNTFTLEYWLKMFPNAKLLYIKRNGVDVAGSLHARATRKRTTHELNSLPVKMKIRNLFSKYERYIYESIRCADLDESFSLWEEYTFEAEKVYENFDGNKMELRYEDFLKKPEEYLGRVTKFVGLSIPNKEEEIANLVKLVNVDRMYAFYSKPHLVSLYQKVKDNELMKKLGYDCLDASVM